MSEPSNLHYTKSHEWVRDEGDGIAVIGITDHAQELLGDLVFVELPGVGDKVDSGSDCAVVESVKAASDIYSPLSGEITEVNEVLEETPETINEDAYGDGWIFKIKMADATEIGSLLDADGYSAMIAEDE
jgi:glycine cleavage system H protein